MRSARCGQAANGRCADARRVKALVWTILILAVAVGLVLAARYNNGYVLVVLPPYRVEIALNLLLILLGFGFVLLYSVSRLVTAAVQMPARVREYRLERRREQARAALLQSLEAYFEGRYATAEQAAKRTIEAGGETRLATVIAARAAHGMRAFDRRDAYLAQIAAEASGDDPLRVITQAELLLEDRRAQEAVELLARLPRKHTAALRLELRARQQTRQWDHALALVDELERRGVYDREQAQRLRTRAVAESLRRKEGDAHAFDEAWRKLTDVEKREPMIAAAAAQCFLAVGRKVDARTTIEASLERNWSSELAALYAACAGPDTLHQIEQAETWLASRPRDSALLLTLGRLCALQGLWGKAQSYFEASISVEPTYVGHLELARLHERLGNSDAARRHDREGLELALEALGKS